MPGHPPRDTIFQFRDGETSAIAASVRKFWAAKFFRDLADWLGRRRFDLANQRSLVLLGLIKGTPLRLNPLNKMKECRCMQHEQL